MKKDIDYKSTVTDFFKSVLDYVGKMQMLYTPVQQEKIENVKVGIKIIEFSVLQLIKERNTSKTYDSQKLKGMEQRIMSYDYGNPFAFLNAFSLPGFTDDTARRAYRHALQGICNYYVLPIKDGEKMLRPLKEWYYVISTKKCKNLVYPFLPLSWFATKHEKAK